MPRIKIPDPHCDKCELAKDTDNPDCSICRLAYHTGYHDGVRDERRRWKKKEKKIATKESEGFVDG